MTKTETKQDTTEVKQLNQKEDNMCLYPRIIENRKYKANKKNGGVIPAVSDNRVLYVPVGCGKCMECVKQKRRNWQVRLLEHVKTKKNGVFITLTFNNESIKELSKNIKLDGYERDNEIARIAVRRFLERRRKHKKKSYEHWLVTELGHNGTENIHLHGIIWTDDTPKEIEKFWNYGYIWDGRKNKGWVNEQTINYITKYIGKTDIKHKEYQAKVFTSKGIGSQYLKRHDKKNNEYKKGNTDETYRTGTGHKIALPIYYRNKIYTEEEKEKLWIEKLDKNERWVNGEKADTSNGEEEYYRLLEYHRAKNKRLGYGDDNINWEKRKYERELRNLKYKERTKRIEKEEHVKPDENNEAKEIPKMNNNDDIW